MVLATRGMKRKIDNVNVNMRVVSTREYKLIPGYIGEAGDRINNQSLVPKCKLRGIRASQVEWSVLLCDAPVFGYASVMHEEPYPIIIQT